MEFISEYDIALLNEKEPFNKCVYEGNFMNSTKTRVFVSSEKCPITTASKIQVSKHTSPNPRNRTRSINHRSHYSKINYLVTKFSYCSEAANIQKQLQK